MSPAELHDDQLAADDCRRRCPAAHIVGDTTASSSTSCAIASSMINRSAAIPRAAVRDGVTIVYREPLTNRIASSPRCNTTFSTWQASSDAISTSTCSRQRANAATAVLRQVGDPLRTDRPDPHQLRRRRQIWQQTLQRRPGRRERRLAGLPPGDATDRTRRQPALRTGPAARRRARGTRRRPDAARRADRSRAPTPPRPAADPTSGDADDERRRTAAAPVRRSRPTPRRWRRRPTRPRPGVANLRPLLHRALHTARHEHALPQRRVREHAQRRLMVGDGRRGAAPHAPRVLGEQRPPVLLMPPAVGNGRHAPRR